MAKIRACASLAVLQTLVRHNDQDIMVISASDKIDHFVFQANSIDAHDGLDFIKPDDTLAVNPGRWIRVKLKAEDVDFTGATPPHAGGHEDGGDDEIDVTGLTGLLADPQTPDAHKTSHENGGGDEISVAGLSGLLADPQTPDTHAASHQNGGGDEIDVTGLSGALADPQVPDLSVQTSAPGILAAALAGAGAGNVEDGIHYYKATFITGSGETEGGTPSLQVVVADKTLDGKVALSSIPLGPVTVTSRKIYRTEAGGSDFKFLAEIADNLTTTYEDNIADAGLGAICPVTNTTDDIVAVVDENGITIGSAIPDPAYAFAAKGTGQQIAGALENSESDGITSWETWNDNLDYFIMGIRGSTHAKAGRGVIDTSVGLDLDVPDGEIDFLNAVDAAGAEIGTLTNSPVAGNPTFWLKVKVLGNTKRIPCW